VSDFLDFTGQDHRITWLALFKSRIE
jgi:hypothetical protein